MPGSPQGATTAGGDTITHRLERPAAVADSARIRTAGIGCVIEVEGGIASLTTPRRRRLETADVDQIIVLGDGTVTGASAKRHDGGDQNE